MLRSLFRKDLSKGVNFDTFEDTMNSVWVLQGKLPGLFQRIRLNHDEAACFIGERSGEDHPSGLVERFHICQMGWAMNFSFGFAFRSVVSEDDEFHRGSRETLYRAFQRTAVFVTGRRFVPPFDLCFAVFPAEKDDTAISKMGEVAETEINVLDENAHFLDGLEIGTDLVQARYI